MMVWAAKLFTENSANMIFQMFRRCFWLVLACALCQPYGIGDWAYAQSQSSIVENEQLQRRVAELIEQLADENYHRRVNANWELERIGLPAFEQLRQAANGHPNPQIEHAARYIVESQNVEWWLQNDSVEVRELLRNYNGSQETERDTLLQQLADIGADDALLALGRLARFESNELRSKSAALYLMNQVMTRVMHAAEETDVANVRGSLSTADASLAKSLKITLGDSRRPATLWLSTLLDELSGAASLEGVEEWSKLLAAERESAARAGEMAVTELKQKEQLRVALRFHRLLAKWITGTRDRDQALELVRPSLKLIGDNPLAIRTAAEWSLEADLPELVPELAEKYEEQFTNEPQLGYSLAESYLRLGDKSKALEAAEQASDSVLRQLQSFRVSRNLNMDEIEASRHVSLAQQLERRGMFEWAEKEYLRALGLELSESMDHAIREDLSRFYWFGNENAKAAEILEPLVDWILGNAEADLPNAPGDFSNSKVTLASYYFYAGLAAGEQGDWERSQEALQKSLEVQSGFPNPDVVIALKKVADQGIHVDYYRSQLDKMTDDFRVRVLEAEEYLSRATDRGQRARAGVELAEACNQLAWLLSKCEVGQAEALNLSLRSLELMPDEPAYMDTLARCYYSAGQIDKAVKVQTRAVKLQPFERQMVLQLNEFKAAEAKLKAAQDPSPSASTES